MHNEHEEHPPAFWRSPGGAALLVIGAVAVYFLVTEHRAHLAGVLPFALLALCPLMHVFMHRGHGGHRHASRADPEAKDTEPKP